MSSLPLIKDIYWKGSRLFIQTEEPINFTPHLTDGLSSYAFKPAVTEKGDLYLDVCNVGNGEMLPAGVWEIEGFYPSEKVFKKMEVLDKVLRYGSHKTYTAKILFTDEKKTVLSTEFLVKLKNPKTRAPRLQLVTWGANMLYGLFRAISPGKEKSVLFLSETRKEMSDNFKAVYEKMIERGLDKEYRIEFLSDLAAKTGNHGASKYLKLKKIAKSNYIFVDDYSPFFSVLNPPKDVKLIQLWHAGFGYKAVGYDRFGMPGSPHPYQSCHRRYTMAICGNEDLREVYATVFGISEDRIFATGMPRLEIMRKPGNIEGFTRKMYNKYEFLKDKRVILFAPTYRGGSQKTAYYNWEMIDQKALANMCRETSSLVVFKNHHFIGEGFKIEEEYKDVLYNLSEENINELMCVTDILITDYSSCFYDYMAIRRDRPVIFYIYDEEEFTNLRGICKPVSETCPGPIARTSDELLELLWKEELPKPMPKNYMIEMNMEDESYSPSEKVVDLVFGEARKE